jgi:hypothetical protein
MIERNGEQRSERNAHCSSEQQIKNSLHSSFQNHTEAAFLKSEPAPRLCSP